MRSTNAANYSITVHSIFLTSLIFLSEDDFHIEKSRLCFEIGLCSVKKYEIIYLNETKDIQDFLLMLHHESRPMVFWDIFIKYEWHLQNQFITQRENSNPKNIPEITKKKSLSKFHKYNLSADIADNLDRWRFMLSQTESLWLNKT
jgi:hypothetical protein